MPNIQMEQEFDLETRNSFTKVQARMVFSVNGRELPNMSVLGGAVEKAIEVIKKDIADSYKIPERVATPVVGTPAMNEVPRPPFGG